MKSDGTNRRRGLRARRQLPATCILAVTGWYGGELCYRHKIGVTGHDE